MPKVKYCLYARKSTESEERQVLSIDSQVKEMLQLADREGLEVVEMKRESHSAKETGKRPVFNEIVEELRTGKYNGILTWAADRISRNAGDLGKVVDLMDAGALQEIRTFSQSFRNNPNEKFLLMILGSQAKLENDNNRGVNVRRGLRTRCEMGLRPGVAPVGYNNEKHAGNGVRKWCQVPFRGLPRLLVVNFKPNRSTICSVHTMVPNGLLLLIDKRTLSISASLSGSLIQEP